MKRFYLSFIALLIFCVMLLTSACGGGNSQEPAPSGQNEENNAETVTFKLGHLSPETSPYQVLALKFKETVEQKTNGKYKIQIYPHSQLGGDKELLEAMQFGNVDMGVITTSPMSNFVPAMATLDLPFVFRDWDHMEKFLASPAASELLNESQQAKLVSLAMMPRGFRSVTNSKHPIAKPGDMSDLKLRVIESPIYVDTFKAMGASAQAMSWGEVFTALQQGTIDGQENAINTIYDEHVYEVNKYVSLTEHMFAFCAIVVSKATWDKLPGDVQKILSDAAVDAAKVVGQQQREEVDIYQKKLEEKGMVFNEVDRDGFREMVKPVYDSFESKYGDKYVKMIDALR